MKMKCVLCKNNIERNSRYFKVELFENKKSMGIDYAHNECWRQRRANEMGIMELTKEASSMIRAMNGNKQEEVVMLV